MKFVHLTSQPSVARVRKNGIRFGDGRRGRGVYAVPLMLMEQESWTRDHQTVDGQEKFFRIIASDVRTSTTLWKWLAKRRRWHRNFAAVVFRTRRQHWPADLYLELATGTRRDWIDQMPSGQVNCTGENLHTLEQAHRKNRRGDLKLTIQNEIALGCALRALQIAGFKTWKTLDEKLELVFPSPIQAGLIHSITPLYRTNQQFKQDRQRQFDVTRF